MFFLTFIISSYIIYIYIDAPQHKIILERILEVKVGMVAKHEPSGFSVLYFISKVFQWYILFDLF